MTDSESKMQQQVAGAVERVIAGYLDSASDLSPEELKHRKKQIERAFAAALTKRGLQLRATNNIKEKKFDNRRKVLAALAAGHVTALAIGEKADMYPRTVTKHLKELVTAGEIHVTRTFRPGADGWPAEYAIGLTPSGNLDPEVVRESTRP